MISLKQVFVTTLPIALASSAWAQLPPQVLVKQRDPIAGWPGHTVREIGRPTANGVGGWACELSSVAGTQTARHIFGGQGVTAGGVLRTETAGIAGYDQQFWLLSSSANRLGLSDAGNLAYYCRASNAGSGSSGLPSVWLDGTPLAVGLDFDFSGPVLTRDGHTYWRSSDRIYRDSLSNVVYDPAAQVGAPPLPDVVMWDVSSLGSHLITGLRSNGTLGVSHTFVDGQPALAAGAPIVFGQPVPAQAGGLPGELWNSVESLAINERGDWAAVAISTIAGQSEASVCVIVNGLIRHRSGDVIDGVRLGGRSESVPPSIALGEQGEVLIGGMFDLGYNRFAHAILVDGRVVLRLGDAVDVDRDGVVDPGARVSLLVSSATRWGQVTGDHGVLVLATVDVNGTVFTADDDMALIRIPLPTLEYGQGKVSSLGTTPHLSTSGTARFSVNNLSLNLSQGIPSSASQAFFGPTRNALPFQGGTLLVGGTIVRLAIVTSDMTGGTSYSIPIDASMVGMVRCYQMWQRDSLHLDGTGLALTNGVEIPFHP